MFLAHQRVLEDGSVARQALADHCRNTAVYACDCLAACGLGQVGYLAGLLHDMGKCKNAFQAYLAAGDTAKRGSVNHTFAGCRYMLQTFHGAQAASLEDLTAEVVAYAIGAHHGLFDALSLDDALGFDHRLHKEGIGYAESVENFLTDCADKAEVAALFHQANEEIRDLMDTFSAMQQRSEDPEGDEFNVYFGLLARLVLSAVIDGDRSDTAAFMNGELFQTVAPLDADVWAQRLAYMEKKLAGFAQVTPIQRARTDISAQCRAGADKDSGVYRLNVPTGGGKTLSALRYALAHAKQWRKERIIFVTPLLAILDQNAAIVRDYIGDDGLILEHHSNVIAAQTTQDALDPRELAMENWQKPVIITTMVQLLNTLFKGATSNVRRFHALSNAVVMIDEVQSVPMNKLSLFNMAVNFLSQVCGTTFLLCSATQPCFEKAAHPMLDTVSDVVPYQEKLWRAFARTEIFDAGAKRLDELPDYVAALTAQAPSVLVVCNKKAQAAQLYHALKDRGDAVFHLSAAMCKAHRAQTLEALYAALKEGRRRVVCVSTQVIEAGVDISFACVVRLLAGMDHVVQAAGRCNRNGERAALAPVYVIACSDEHLGKLPDIQREKVACRDLLAAFSAAPDDFDGQLSSEGAIQWYYQKLYGLVQAEGGNVQDDILPDGNDTLFSLLGSNRKHLSSVNGRYFLNQAFKTAGACFHVFAEDTVDVVVPFGEGAALIAELEREAQPSLAYLKTWSERAKPYTAALYAYQREQLGALVREVHGVLVLSKAAYDDRLGVQERNEQPFLEV